MLLEAMILSFGGQGGVTAARVLAICAVKEGKYAQAIPHFGAERRGALVRSFLRISDKPIRRHSLIKNPDVIIVFSEKILEMMEVSADTIIINSREPKIKGAYYVDASTIALNLNLISAGWPIVNTAMAGATAKALGFSLTSLKQAINDVFSGKLAELNIKAAEIAYKEVKRWNA
ncbi:MAG TPA: pyruvate oxidoreductase subunit gamma [Archaeoglobus profundus]|nr:pyruvate oxidoreductase subunit gamma [Archaeoglobus profundus]